MARAVAPAWRSCCQELAVGGGAAGGLDLAAERKVTVQRHLRRRALDAHLLPGGIELLGHDGRQPGPHALARLEVLAEHGDGVVGRDAHERHRERTRGSRRTATGAGPRPQPGSTMPSVSPEPASVVSFRNWRRVSSEGAAAARGRCGLLDVTQIHDAVLIEAVQPWARSSARRRALSAAWWMAPRMRTYVAQRQMLPAMAESMSASLGFGFVASSAEADMICPLWQ